MIVFIIVVLCIILAIAAVTIQMKHLSSILFVCPSCYHTFKGKMLSFLFQGQLYSGDKKLLMCPKCGKRGWCVRSAYCKER
jgi:hypothetical protein